MARIAAVDLLGEPGDLAADVQRAHVALQEPLRLAEKAVDLLKDRQADAGSLYSPLDLQLGDVDLVLNELEESWLAIELGGQLVEDRRHGRRVLAMRPRPSRRPARQTPW